MMTGMQLRETIEYDAPPEQVFAMLCDQAWREQVCEATHALHWNVRIEAVDGGATVTVVREVRAQVPAAVRAMVGDTIEIVATEAWGPAGGDGSRTADLQVQISRQPAGMTGNLRLEPVGGGGTRETLVGDVKVNVPFFGRTIEPEIAKAIRAALVVEGTMGRAYLAR